MDSFWHQSVLGAEVIAFLSPRPGGVYLDATLGGGGHSELILEKISPDGLLIGIDRDQAALDSASERLGHFGNSFRPVKGDFGELAKLLQMESIDSVDGILLDLGVSSHQLDTAERGFSFRSDGPLDMRMDCSSGETASDIINRSSAAELEKILRNLGEERWAKKIAANIVQANSETPIRTTFQLADIVLRTIPRRFQEERIHPATRTFQALRIAVNQELEQVKQGVSAGIGLLKPCGRIVVISFHSLEDRIVKHLLREAATGCVCPPKMPCCICNRIPQLRILTGKPVTADDDELQRNPRSRSAKLRAAEKI